MEATKKSIGSYLFRPFLYIAGGKSLCFGVIVMFVMVFLSCWSLTVYDGFLDTHYLPLDKPIPFFHHVYYVFGSWAVSVLVFYAVALLVSKAKTRIIDIAGTLAIAKAPYILSAIVGFIPAVHLSFGTNNVKNITVQDTLTMLQNNIGWIIFISFIGLITMIWFILLTYNAYSVSANIKGNKGILSFIAALLISEVLSKALLYFVL
jgi:hypothetical protein